MHSKIGPRSVISGPTWKVGPYNVSKPRCTRRRSRAAPRGEAALQPRGEAALH
jgi:hypothetical protein